MNIYETICLFFDIQVWAASQNLTLQDAKKGEPSKKSKTMSQAMLMKEGQGQFGKKKIINLKDS